MSLLNTAEANSGRGMRRKGKTKISLAAFVDEFWLPWAKRTQKSWRVSSRIAAHFILPFFGEEALAKISFSMVRQWQKRLKALGLAPSTINRILSVFKTICNLAEARHCIDRDFSPALALDWAKVQKPAARILGLEDLCHLLGCLKDSERQEARAVLLLIYTGAAKNVVLKARWHDLNLAESILISHASRGPDRILLPAEAVGLLGRMPAGSGTDCLFPGRLPDQPRDDIFSFWNETRESAGLSGLLLRDAQASYSHWRLRLGPEALHMPDQGRNGAAA